MKTTRNLKIWFILINNQEEGPYSLLDLRQDRRLTPLILVRKAGSKKWLPLGKIEALREVFADESSPDTKENTKERPLMQGGEVLLLSPSDPDGPITLIVFIILLLVVWVVYNTLF